MRQVNIHITAKPDKDSSSSGFAISERVREFIMFICTFKYKPEDVECIYCLHFQHHRCLMDDGCPYIAERIEAGAIDYDALISDTFRSPTGILRRRLHQLITHFNGSLWEDNSHAQRFSQTLREIGYYRKADAPRYDEAKAAVEERHAAGLGFKIPEGYFFLDIDHRALTDPLVQTLFARFDSYAEYSVSGKGIHQYGKCDFTKLPTYIDKDGKVRLDGQFYQKNPNNELELYVGGITNRFAAHTGNVIEGKPLRECKKPMYASISRWCLLPLR